MKYLLRGTGKLLCRIYAEARRRQLLLTTPELGQPGRLDPGEPLSQQRWWE